MKPVNFNKKQRQSVARVKTIIKDKLAWMKGFPVFEGKRLFWIYTKSTFLHDQKIKVSADVISKSQRAINTLFRDYPDALPKVVGDLKQWHDRHTKYLQYAKSLLAERPDRPISLFELDKRYRSAFKKQWQQYTQNKDLLTAITWKFFTEQQHAKLINQFLANYAINDSDLELQEWMNLLTLYVQEPIKSSSLINFLITGHDMQLLCHQKYEYFSPYLKHKTKKDVLNVRSYFNPNNIPKSDNKAKISQFLQELSELKPTQVRRALMIFQEINLLEIVQDWQIWWAKANSCLQKIKNHIIYPGEVNINEINALQEQLKHLIDDPPRDSFIDSVLNALITFAQKKTVAQSLVAALKSVQTSSINCMLPHEMLYFWSRLDTYCKPKDAVFVAYLNGLNQVVQIPAPHLKKPPWRKQPHYIWNAKDNNVLDFKSIQKINDFFEVLSSIIKDKTAAVKSIRLSLIITLVRTGLSPSRIHAIYFKLYKHSYSYHFPRTLAKIIQHFDLNEDETHVLIDLYAESETNWQFFKGLKFLMKSLQSHEQKAFLKRFLFQGEIQQLFDAIAYVQVIVNHSGEAALPQPPSDQLVEAHWIKNYPEPFHGLLGTLNGVCSDAEDQAFQVFKSVWWPRSILKTEINKLQNHLRNSTETNQSKVINRIDKLQEQLADHKPINAHKTDKLLNKLDKLNRKKYVAYWQRDLEQQFLEDWAAIFHLEVDDLPEWLTQTRMITKLIPILSFDKPIKSLAIKIIHERVQGPYFYLENHGKNKQFRKKFKHTEIKLDAWPEKFGTYEYYAQNDQKITLSIESDPLAVLDMGGHFGTCLSPGDFNYFSVFPNIADVNKAVIYAKNEDNKVVGRVLLGITEQGGLQVFYRYSHHVDYQFGNHVMLFIDQIADQTGLTLTHRGSVEPLCGNDWYDDGATQFNRSFPCFMDESTFRCRIQDLTVDDFETILIQELAPKKLNSLAFTTLISLPELTYNSDIYPALLKLSIQIENLAEYDLLQLYQLAPNTEQRHACFATHQKALFNYFIKQIMEYNHVDYDDIAQIAEHHPSDALKIIKKHAKAEKQDWKNNPVYGAAHATQVALKQLAREEQAESIRNIAHQKSKLKH